MDQSTPTTQEHAVANLRTSARGAIVTVALLAAACGGAAAAPSSGHQYAAHTSVPEGRTPATAAADAAGTARTTFRTTIGTHAAAFVTDIGRLRTDAAAGDVQAARQDELAAQADYDQFRVLEGDYAITTSAIDEVATEVAPGQTFTGLHAVERDLWPQVGATTTGPAAPSASGVSAAALADAGTDLTSLVAQAPVAEYLLSRSFPQPDAIVNIAVAELDWVASTAVPGYEEQFSHFDLVDVTATLHAASEAVAAVTPLGMIAAPAATAGVAAHLATLTAVVAGLGPPTSTTDASITTAQRRAVTQQVDATVAELAGLSSALLPYGSGGWPS